jgi:hypothetical protein
LTLLSIYFLIWLKITGNWPEVFEQSCQKAFSGEEGGSGFLAGDRMAGWVGRIFNRQKCEIRKIKNNSILAAWQSIALTSFRRFASFRRFTSFKRSRLLDVLALDPWLCVSGFHRICLYHFGCFLLFSISLKQKNYNYNIYGDYFLL